MAVCAAAAVAGAVSAALDGCPGAEVLTVAIPASTGAEGLRPSTEAIQCTSIEGIYPEHVRRKHLIADELATSTFPDKPQNIVPLAISLALVTQSAQQTALFAANIGGDSDSVASIGGAIAGALYPETVNEEWFEVVSTINDGELTQHRKIARRASTKGIIRELHHRARGSLLESRGGSVFESEDPAPSSVARDNTLHATNFGLLRRRSIRGLKEW